MPLPRRALLGAGLAGVLAAPRLGRTQAGFPSQSVTFVIPFAPG